MLCKVHPYKVTGDFFYLCLENISASAPIRALVIYTLTRKFSSLEGVALSQPLCCTMKQTFSIGDSLSPLLVFTQYMQRQTILHSAITFTLSLFSMQKNGVNSHNIKLFTGAMRNNYVYFLCAPRSETGSDAMTLWLRLTRFIIKAST